MALQQALNRFVDGSDIREASMSLLECLGVTFTQISPAHLPLNRLFPADSPLLRSHQDLVDKVTDVGIVGVATDETFSQNAPQTQTIDEVDEKLNNVHYEEMAFFSIETNSPLTLTDIRLLTRSFNKRMKNRPVVLLILSDSKLSLSTCERSAYIRSGYEGEKTGKVTVLRNIECRNDDTHTTHRGHLDILTELDSSDCNSFDKLYRKWINKFDIQTLNNKFYKEIQSWFYWATEEIELPDYENTNLTETQFNQNFLVRLLSRMMFCWFLKEKKDKNGNSVIDNKLLELVDPRTDDYYPIVADIEDEDFLDSSSYYRGILQNIFFGGLNSNTKKSKKDFKCLQYLPSDFDFSLFVKIPFLNGSTFRPLDEDFFKDSIDDDAFLVPNYLFYGDGENRGINEIFNDYKFTVEENTPSDVDIALDPEMLGMVFENLLAEIDPQNESAARSIRKATGSYYTPRPVIQEMSNESIMQYLYRQIKTDDIEEKSLRNYLIQLIYNENKTTDTYDDIVVKLLHNIRVLDPACGSGAFPMGMLQRIVDILRVVDPQSKVWLKMMLQPIEEDDVREQFRKQLEGTTSDYQRKLGIIRNCIYAIDIQPIAVQITKLRFFISLLADQEVDTTLPNSGILSFPNLETKIVCADSLKNINADFFVDQAKAELIKARKQYYQPNIAPTEREKIADEIADIMDNAFPTFAEQINLPRVCNKAVLKRWFIDANINAPFFDMDTFFPEIKEGFDIVIGNPPYGGFKIAEDVRDALALGSNDPYGAFISRFLGNGTRPTPLKNGGTLAFIVSDTFMTIGSHLKLRQQMMRSRIHKMLRMSPKTFSATVNTVIIFCEKCKYTDKDEAIQNNVCTMADMTNIDIHEDYKYFAEVLSQSMDMDTNDCISNEEYAIYRYPQTLIRNCSNLPFFVASPKLFELMNDVNPVRKGSTQINGMSVQYRVNRINGKEIVVYKLGDVSDVKVGLQTGDNPAYLFQNPEARGSYRDINDYEDYILTEDDLNRIHSDNRLRLSIIEKGISVDDPNSDRYFGGRYIARYDKGGESDAEGGWMPNYYVPTDYYIDWSEWAVNRMQTLTIAQRKIDNKENKKVSAKDKTTLSGVYRNSLFYFKKSITYSKTGVYTPTFRIGEGGPFDQKSSFVDIQGLPVEYSICILSSKLMRCLQKSILNHSVDFGKEDMILLPFTMEKISKIESLAKTIIQKQKEDRFYDYASHEQIEIDRLVCEAYGLNEDDIIEVETWYVRRYPKLAAAQLRNLELVKQQEA